MGSMELAARTVAEIWPADAQWDYQYGRSAAPGQLEAGRLEVQG